MARTRTPSRLGAAIAVLVVIASALSAFGALQLYDSLRGLPPCPQAKPPSRPPERPRELSAAELDAARSAALSDAAVRAIAQHQPIGVAEVLAAADPLSGAREAEVRLAWARPTTAPASLFRSIGARGVEPLDAKGSFDHLTGLFTSVRLPDRDVIRVLPGGRAVGHGLTKSSCRAQD